MEILSSMTAPPMLISSDTIAVITHSVYNLFRVYSKLTC